MQTDAISRSAALEALQGIDWYHVNKKGSLVHGSTSDEVSYIKYDDAFRVLEDATTIDAVPVVRCKDCWKRGGYQCPMFYEEFVSYDEWDSAWIEHDNTTDDGFCNLGARMDGDLD